MLKPNKFRFLNREHTLVEHGAWNDQNLEKLWLYNLHYFDDLNAAEAQNRNAWHIALMDRWCAENPPTSGNGWEPYPTSLRIVNWIKWAIAGNSLSAECVDSLAVQARWLSRRLEWHLLGNHLFANAKALVFVGLFFEGAEASNWLDKGLRIIEQQLPEQVLPDGGNFERSPMYHAIFLEDLLDLLNAATVWSDSVDSVFVVRWRETAQRMLSWLLGMTHPDGQIALFNDAAVGVASSPDALLAYARRLDVHMENRADSQLLELQQWQDSGYVRLASKAAVALLDVAPVGPDYLPGHAHADTLSFELSVFGQRVVVNGGTSCYGISPDRVYERETTAHSTVEVAGQSSSEVWGGFRVARRAYPFDLQTLASFKQLRVACSHDGYARLAGKPIHRRDWTMDEHGLRVMDTLMGGRHSAVARYILHPEVSIRESSANTWSLGLPGGRSMVIRVSAGEARLESSRYAPEFGLVLTTKCLAVDLTNGEAHLELLWG